MKYALYIILLFSLPAIAQDSSKLYVKNVPFRAGDVKAITRLLTTDEMYEDFLQMAQTKAQSKPSNTTVVTFDSLRVDVLLGVYNYAQNIQNGLAGSWTSRISTVLKTTIPMGVGVVYLRQEIQTIDAHFTAIMQREEAYGQRRLYKERN